MIMMQMTSSEGLENILFTSSSLSLSLSLEVNAGEFCWDLWRILYNCLTQSQDIKQFKTFGRSFRLKDQDVYPKNGSKFYHNCVFWDYGAFFLIFYKTITYTLRSTFLAKPKVTFGFRNASRGEGGSTGLENVLKFYQFFWTPSLTSVVGIHR